MQIERIVNQVVTLDANPVELFRVTVPALSAFKFAFDILAASTAGSVAAWKIEVSGKRSAGAFALVGAPTTVHSGKDAGAAAWALVPSAAGNDFVLSVTGAAATSITWAGEIEYRILTP